MKHFTRIAMLLSAGATLAGLLIMVGTVGVTANDAGEEAGSVSKTKTVYLATSTIPVTVSGMVEAADSAVIYAQTAGVVSEVLIEEGTTVSAGALLAKQDTPLADAERSLAFANGELVDLQRGLEVLVRDTQAEQAEVQTYSAKEVAILRNLGNDSRVKEAGGALVTQLESDVLTATEAIDFANNNRSLFTAEGREVYDEVVNELYGLVPNYFRGSIMPHNTETISLKELLVETDGSEYKTTNLVSLAEITKEQIDALSYLFSTAEEDVFDRQTGVESTLKSEYLATREALLESKQLLETTAATYQTTLDSVLEESVSLNTTVAVTTLDEETAAAYAEMTEAIAAQSRVVSSANEGVAAAAQSLGRLTAPFAGKVGKVYVEAGEYVMPGTPLFTLVGDGAKEIKVTIPTYLLSDLGVGQTFSVAGEAVGVVDRFSLISEGGSATVIISLQASEIIVGSSLSGVININSDTITYTVPRHYVHFDASGPFVRYKDGSVSRVEVVHDTGSTLYLKVNQVSQAALVPAVSIAL